MIGDPLQVRWNTHHVVPCSYFDYQLPPTVTTGCDEQNTGEGIDKTLFDRLTEVNCLGERAMDHCQWLICVADHLVRWVIK